MSRPLLFRLLAVGMGVAVSGLIVEAGLAIYVSSLRVDMPTDLFVPADDPLQAYQLMPGYRNTDHAIPVFINDLGLRSGPLNKKKPGVTRILCLGDSMTFGFGVRAEDAFCARLAGMLSERTGREMETINAGVPGYNAKNCLGLLRRVGRAVDPDLVLYLFVSNDLDDTLYPDERHVLYAARHPDLAASHRASSTWLWDTGFFRMESLVGGSGFLGHLRLLVSGVLFGQPNVLLGDLPKWHTPFVQGLSPASMERWAGFKKTLGEIRDESRRLGAKLRLAAFPFGLEGYPLVRLSEAAREAEVPLLDLSPVLGSETDYMQRLALPLDPHPNPRGHEVIARKLEHWLESEAGGEHPLPKHKESADQGTVRPGISQSQTGQGGLASGGLDGSAARRAVDRQTAALEKQDEAYRGLSSLVDPERRVAIQQIDDGIYPDGWVVDRGCLLLGLGSGPGPWLVRVRGWARLEELGAPWALRLWATDGPSRRVVLRQGGSFEATLALERRPGDRPFVELHFQAERTFNPKKLGQSGDDRNLSFRLDRAEVSPVAADPG